MRTTMPTSYVMLVEDASFTVAIPPTLDGVRLDRALAELVPTLSRERIKALMSEGYVTALNGAKGSSPSAKAVAGTSFIIMPPPARPLDAEAQAIDLAIAYEDDDLIVVDKQAGLVVHPAAGNLDGTLVNALLHHCAGQLSGIGGVARPGIVHRIDKDTSGLIVVAKNDRAHEGLAIQFKDHSIERRYLAIVGGLPMPPAGTIDTWIGRSDSNRKKMAVLPTGRGKHAVTHFRTMSAGSQAALVECQLETGRTHQVRVHMAHIGHALIGDPVYGRPVRGLRPILETLRFNRQALHAAVLGFTHPVSRKALRFESAMPSDMQLLFSHLFV